MVTPLEMIVGEPVNGVAFVMDYVELHFNGPILRFISEPTVRCGDRAYTFPEIGSRDALCQLIGDRPTGFEVHPNEELIVLMAGGCSVTVPISSSASPSGESLHFLPGKGQPISVW
jgi:hypothetical protein